MRLHIVNIVLMISMVYAVPGITHESTQHGVQLAPRECVGVRTNDIPVD